MVALQVENVIASSSLGKEVELVRLGTELEHAQYTRGLTPSVIVDLDGDGAGGRTGLVFGSGQLYVTGIDEQGKTIEVSDPLASELANIAETSTGDIANLVENYLHVSEIFGNELPQSTKLKDAVTKALKSLTAKGALQSVADYARK